MSRIVRGTACLLALTAAMIVVVAVRADENKDIQKQIVDWAKAAEGGKEPDAKALSKFKEKYDDLDAVMSIYKPSAKKGLGFGKKGAGDGIEQQLNNMVKRAPAVGKLKADLVKLGYLNLVMAKVAREYAPKKPKGGKGAKEWNQYCEDMEKASKEFIAAAKAANAPKLKAAAKKLTDACTSCHSDFK